SIHPPASTSLRSRPDSIESSTLHPVGLFPSPLGLLYDRVVAARLSTSRWLSIHTRATSPISTAITTSEIWRRKQSSTSRSPPPPPPSRPCENSDAGWPAVGLHEIFPSRVDPDLYRWLPWTKVLSRNLSRLRKQKENYTPTSPGAMD
ncbi:hypothetical protein CP533_4527, partial [Ophiocordyceps camponoti-saundersi (nom. inval.)]